MKRSDPLKYYKNASTPVANKSWTLMNPVAGFSSTASQSCQPHYDRNREKGWGRLKKKKGCSWTNVPLSVADALPGQPYSSRTMADIRNHSGHCSPWWSPLGLTGLLSKTQPLKPSAFHHCTEMTTQTCYFVGWRDSPWHCHCTAMRCQWRHQNLSLMGEKMTYMGLFEVWGSEGRMPLHTQSH